MSYKYQSIKLSGDFDKFKVNGNKEHIDGLSPINIFIGENNAGKSRFMRELAKHDHSQEFQIDSYSLGELRSAFDIFIAQFDRVLSPFKHTAANTTGVPGFSGNIDAQNLDLSAYIPDAYTPEYFDDYTPNPRTLLKFFKAIENNQIQAQSFRGDWQSALIRMQGELSEDYVKDFITILKRFNFSKIQFDKYYIPTLRSLNNFQEYQSDKTQDIYEARVRKIYSFDKSHEVDVFTGQKIYDRIRNMLLGDIELRERIRDYEKFLSEKLFNQDEVVIIPKIGKDVVAVKIGNSPERPIYELGDGIQSLIILTFPLFESEHGMFFIEEPELNMHPGMQRKFIEAIQAHPQHQYFFTTHSNHILDLTIDYSNISIYSFKNIDSDTKEVELVTKGDKNVLDLIGARNTSVFLSNKSIWVEGITDRLYLRKYLELYIENHPALNPIPREDIDYIFVEYGGNNITHWSFLDSTDPTINVDRLAGNLMIVVDDDGDKKQDRKTALKAKLGKRYLKLDEREIENTLSLDVISQIILSYEPKSKQPVFDLGKIDGSELSTLPIGNYIENKLFSDQKLSFNRRGGYAADSGTIKNKLDFCHRALNILTYDNMTESSKEIAKKLYEFIVE